MSNLNFSLFAFLVLLFPSLPLSKPSSPLFFDEEKPSSRPNYVLRGVSPQDANITVRPIGNYQNQREAILARKERLFNELSGCTSEEQTNALLDKASDYFTETLLNQIIPHWYGTAWDYNGYTDMPGKGLVACGYFVSTTLKHCGVSVNRFDLARTYSLKAVKVLHGPNLIDLSGQGLDSVIQHLLNTESEGFYVVGLDNHIGFLLKRSNEVYFIHSSYLDPGTVCIELASNALALEGHQNYVLAQLSGNPYFTRKWLNGEEFIVP